MRFLSADTIFPIETDPIPNGILAVSANGTIHDLLLADDMNAPDESRVEKFKGILCPGFVNAHCHLELSHMKGLVPEKTGLPKFISEIIARRIERALEKQELIRQADAEMWANGIQVVGDICNTTDGIATKLESRIDYHSFVEVFSLDPAKADQVLAEGLRVARNHLEVGLNATIVPHAPYSVSSVLFDGISALQKEFPGPISMHNQETPSEDEMFATATGELVETFEGFGVNLSDFKAGNPSSLSYALPQLPKYVNTVLVHNTYTGKEEMRKAIELRNDLFWCTCPNANRYIENRIPSIVQWLEIGATICIGTDSLASNHQLSILDELKLIQGSHPSIQLSELLRMATLNGARALNLEKKTGSFQKGKLPGVIWLRDVEAGQQSLMNASVQRIF